MANEPQRTSPASAVPPSAQSSAADVTRVVLQVGHHVATSLAVSARDGGEILARHAQRVGHPLPATVELPPQGGRLRGDQATLVLTYATASLVRGRAADARGASARIASFLGVTAAEQELTAPILHAVLASLPPTPPPLALQHFFEPEDAVKHLATRLIQRVEVRRERRPVAHLRPSDYEHPGDRVALDKIRAVPGIEALFRKVSELSIEKILVVESLANHVHVGPDQFPQLHALFAEAAEMVGLTTLPELFLELGPPNARTLGVERPMVVLSYALPSLCSRDELLFVMGHELGHIRSGHSPFQMARLFLPQLLDVVGQMTLGLGGLVGAGVEALLFDWYRKSELTCDRCGLLVCQNPDAALTMMMKLAGAPPSLYGQLNLDAFLRQAIAYDALDQSLLARTYKFVMTTMGQLDHPWPALRARELARWVNAGEYERLLRVSSGGARQCLGCGGGLTPEDVFCSHCGRRAGA